MLEPVARKSDVTLAVAGDAETALVDAAQIEQVLANLLVNGVHAMRERGTVEVTVEATRAAAPADLTSENDEWVRLTVRDHGIGIAPADLPHVFEPFFTTKDIGDGTGLGLAVAYGIVRDHGGWIDVESEQGRGTSFSVYLQRAPA
jgi:two-component system, NtrC family, sensor kinase